MIYTLTLNPAIDMNIVSDNLLPNVTTRTRETVLTANGKGINVSRVLKHFGRETAVLGFFGGFTGEYIVNECDRWGLNPKPIMIDGETRINVFLGCGEGEYKMVNEGPSVSEADMQEMLALLENVDDMEVLTINGSAAKNISVGFYDSIIEIAQKNGTEVVLDISVPYLKELLRYRPLLVKPNDEEIEKIFKMKVFDDESAKAAMRVLWKMGAQNILLTLGKKGSYFFDGKIFYKCGTQEVKLRSSLCAGDGFLAAFLASWLGNEKNVSDALKIASATGANIAESDGIGTLEKVEIYKNNISVTEI